MAKPKPIAKQVVCSECALPWDDHTKGRKTDPTPDVCVRLLKAELAKRPRQMPYFSSASNAAGGTFTNVLPLRAVNE
jgi:hypothetical protein